MYISKKAPSAMSVWPPRIPFAFSSVLMSDNCRDNRLDRLRQDDEDVLLRRGKTHRLRRFMLATRYGLESASQNLSDVGPAEEGKNDHDSIYEVDVAERFADRSE